ncbi:hypothetical protein ASPZODRAFT_70550 [Penicilliopsis zonata CBS 506.65]|uniref:Uncharacterized protein n=1 Tax=Penicilliopsis zonata CBS 506.65 TaxID=1073090 RepID=A0A1L9SD42_9EURO|nr:hypothetical protein ASPZODRAFT_70550 [Penicilliopsis zonata CBS 506.65]OJJ45007.1 hypothetical protein ASPZODRAFT_70550 [Penicilliopsis zonata CBS 506.65]
MCRPTTCPTCQKTTWMGCGRHVPSVMDAIDASQWCECKPQVEKEGKMYPPGPK